MPDKEMDLLDRLREEQEEVTKNKKLMGDLLAHPGWKLLATMVTGGIQTRRQADFGKLIGSMDDAFQSAGARAEIAGMLFVLKLPENLLQNLLEDAEHIKAQIEGAQDV